MTAQIGKIRNAHGVRGQLKISLLSNLPKLSYLIIQGSRHTIESLKKSGSFYILKLKEIDDRDSALSLRSCMLEILREDLPPLSSEVEHYCCDLIGKRVQNLKNENLGTVSNVLETPASDLLQVQSIDKTLLIPFVARHVVEVGDVIRVDWEKDWS